MMNFKGRTGEIAEVHRSERKVCLEWKIPRFLQLSSLGSDFYESPRFSFYDTRWYMRVYPYLDLLGLLVDGSESVKTVNVAVGMKGSEVVEKKSRKVPKFSSLNLSNMMVDFCLRSGLQKEKLKLKPEDALTVTCEIEIQSTLGRDEDKDFNMLPAQSDKNELQSILKTLNAKLEDLSTCNDLILKNGTALQRSLSELESLETVPGAVNKIKSVNERATLFRITSNAMINACQDYMQLAQSQGRKWQKMLQHEHEQRLRLEEMVEQLAKQHSHLERAAKEASVNSPADISLYQDACIQTDGQIKETGAFTDGSKTSNKQEASTQTDPVFKEERVPIGGSLSAEKQGTEKVLEDMENLWISGKNSDVTIQVKDSEFKVHGSILSARSPVLSAMMEHDTTERASRKIRIDDCEPEAFEQYIRYLYTGTVQFLSQRTALSLYRVADKYLAGDLKLVCLEHVRDTLCVPTFCDTVVLALTYSEGDLLQKALEFATRNFQSIVVSNEWQNFICECPREANEILVKCFGPQSRNSKE